MTLTEEAELKVLSQMDVIRALKADFAAETEEFVQHEAMSRDAAQRRAVTAAHLADLCQTQSEVAGILGLSIQRASQLVQRGREILASRRRAEAAGDGSDLPSL